MDELRNLPQKPAELASLIEYRPNTVVSMALSRHPAAQMTLFAFDEGDGVSTEYYLGDTLYLVLEGKMPLVWKKQSYLLGAGDCMRLPAGEEHAIGGAGPFKLLQITLSLLEE